MNTHFAVVTKCTFETSQICGYTQDKTDTFDWTWHHGSTTSVNTGPLTDHTLGTSFGHYVYTETSAPRKRNDRARLLSPKFNSDGSTKCLQFYYHMHGRNIGKLNVYLKAVGVAVNHTSPLWSRAFNQGNVWHRGQVSMFSSSQYQVGTDLQLVKTSLLIMGC